MALCTWLSPDPALGRCLAHWVDYANVDKSMNFCSHKIVSLQLSDSDYEDEELYKDHIINVLQDIMEIITQDIMIDGHE